jgi:hypothetical protein
MQPHPQAEATYRVVPIEGGAFAVEVTAPEAEPAMVRSFATVADAETWIAKQKVRVLESRPRRTYYQRRAAAAVAPAPDESVGS